MSYVDVSWALAVETSLSKSLDEVEYLTDNTSEFFKKFEETKKTSHSKRFRRVFLMPSNCL
ncbi:hypothetical protein AB834_02415 [PVC group bacterium (ex Bugula neritina AB1)]|nr:hypothetical protein AB834_02415 [PVC group bacterium (ex Bugula neritina AB1)]